MPQAYSAQFAHLYNRRWTEFANHVAPYLTHFYADTELSKTNKHVLDLCCGTGQLALHFLQFNYQITGLDLSHAMLQHARENTRQFVEAGLAHFVQGDAANFTFNRKFGLVLSTFDALNHLPDEQALRDCFACTATACEGTFIFDLNTRRGLNNWDGSFIQENSAELTLL
ncbi:MAG: class I SAM-dependent methyltransferase [Anaerolineaceae bacterium]|nr:class I SAM-dependent methyltransferase [Anaerolineaceae bacterium]